MSEAKKRRSTGRVTLNDVAQLAGVGAMTVSRALRTPELVSDKMRERIDAAVDELGYIPNRAAGALASATSQTIVVIVPSLTERGCGDVIAGLGTDPGADAKVFHAGTAMKNGQVVTAGGRVLCACALGTDIADAQRRAYAAADNIHWDGVFYRSDIGWRALERPRG